MNQDFLGKDGCGSWFSCNPLKIERAVHEGCVQTKACWLHAIHMHEWHVCGPKQPSKWRLTCDHRKRPLECSKKDSASLVVSCYLHSHRLTAACFIHVRMEHGAASGCALLCLLLAVVCMAGYMGGVVPGWGMRMLTIQTRRMAYFGPLWERSHVIALELTCFILVHNPFTV